MSNLRVVKRDNKGPGRWISGNDLRRSDHNYIEIIQEKQERINRLEKELCLQNCVIDQQKETIQKLSSEKPIVADWLEPSTVIPSLTKQH